ncbi:MAG: DPP IV N-terminal domain-containing protein [Gemmatimonadales bacterium]
MDVTTATTGASLDPDGYALTVDGGEAQSIGVDETVTLAGLEPGDHEVALTELTPNCAVSGPNPQTVTVVAGESVTASFEIECGFVSLEIAYTRVGARGGVFVTTETGSYTFTLRSNSISGQSIYLDPTWSPDGVRIAFLETDNNIFEDFLDLVWVANVDGSNPVQVTNEQGYFDGLAWSPDGTQIAYAGWLDDDADVDVYVMGTDGSNPVNLTNYPAADSDPAWSPDGTKIAFTAFRDGNPEIYVMEADGSNQLRLTDDSGWDDLPAWSPDGTKIAFTTDRDGNSEIYVMDADGSHLVNLTNNAGEQWDPAWSPDGSRIAFANDWDIYVMDADGSNAINLTNSPSQEFGPAWSPSPQEP